ncbi:hypothetical protein M433DRAFT_64291 [Acidomyces richmondensis BFW]|nr:MAG: hypothetical protein FE78DRAFT_144338 [Acidomyces sp. 'richmondensis']KYG46858.1 hypothetical protein M433DRAFT_64291 [Acidomyces richmondensis BFW]
MNPFDLSSNNLVNLLSYHVSPSGLSLTSKVSLPAGAHFANLTEYIPQSRATWRTIQTSATTHAEPRCALLYLNHSCQPTLEVHVHPPAADGTYPNGCAAELRVARDRNLQVGDELTFFYPSTEWEFDREFDCLCDAPKSICIGRVQGAKNLNAQVMGRWWMNKHILDLRSQSTRTTAACP